MPITGGQLLDRLLQDLARSFPVAAFVGALGEPPELVVSLASQNFWQHELKTWIRADYAPRLERVLRAYKSLRPEDVAPAN